MVNDMRLFIAIKLNARMRKRVREVQESFRRQGVRGNYTPEENLHITLAFIGEYGDPDGVLEAMEGVDFQPFSVRMDKVGCFDELWWTGFADSEELNSLAGKIRRALADAGVPYDRKKFKAHTTFLRKAEYGRHGQVVHTDLEPAGMQVDRISLMCSSRGKNGMFYTEIGSAEAR